jgi:hypothetical protein
MIVEAMGKCRVEEDKRLVSRLRTVWQLSTGVGPYTKVLKEKGKRNPIEP